MRRLSRYCIALITALAASVAGMHVVQAASSEESGFRSRINADRSQRGLGTLSWSEDLAVVARRHAKRMADENNLYHNPNLRSEVGNWEVLGENVGYGPGVDELHQAFMNSASHRANILDSSYTQIGVGTVWRDGQLWVVEVFRKPASSSGSSAPAPRVRKKTPRPVSRPASKPAPKPASKPAPELPAAPAPVSSSELTRRMVENLLAGQEPALGAVAASDAESRESRVMLSFRPFADIAGRVGRQIRPEAEGR